MFLWAGGSAGPLPVLFKKVTFIHTRLRHVQPLCFIRSTLTFKEQLTIKINIRNSHTV